MEFRSPPRNLACKIVYYGCALAGKTTSFQYIFQKAPNNQKNEMMRLADIDAMHFSFRPSGLGSVREHQRYLRLFSMGQKSDKSAKKAMLRGTNGIVLVVDSRKNSLQDNVLVLQELEELLFPNALSHIPVVIQWNKRDLPDILSIAQLERKINLKVSAYETVAITGEKVWSAFQKCMKLSISKLEITNFLWHKH